MSYKCLTNSLVVMNIRTCFVLISMQYANAFSDLHGIPPLITPMQPDFTATSGKNVSFKCRSNEPIHWKVVWQIQQNLVDALAFNSNMHYFSFAETELPKSGSYYDVQLDLIKVNYLYVGFYYCIKNSAALSNLETQLENNLASKIYLFVQDDENPVAFIGIYPLMFPSYVDEAVIPCKPTSKNIAVEFNPDVKAYAFNEYLGTIVSTHELVRLNTTSFQCYSKDGKVERDFEIYISSEYRSNGPVIKSTTDNFGIEANNLELNCSCDGLTSKNITWELPPIAQMENRVQYSDGSLNIQNLNKGKDAAVYKCTAHFASGTKSASLSVTNISDSFIEVLPSSNYLEVGAEEEAKWVVRYLSYPGLTTIVWRDKNNVVIPWTKEEKAAEKLIAYRDKTCTVLKIRDTNSGDSGNYTLEIRNDRSPSKVETFELKFVGSDKQNGKRETGATENDVTLYVGLSLVAALAVIVIIYLCVRHRRKFKLTKNVVANFLEGKPQSINPELALDEQAYLLPYNMNYEFPRERLELGKQLGSGAFGVVLKGTARGILATEQETTVAVKMIKPMMDADVIRALITELKIMVNLGGHLNIVNLLGAVTKNIDQREVMIIVEYCRFGNLKDVLLKQRPLFIDQIDRNEDIIDSSIKRCRLDGIDHSSHRAGRSRGNSNNEQIDDDSASSALVASALPPITTSDLLCWSYQVARGMHYLSSRNVLHGDLAARNVLLCDDNIVKICDFGLARSMYKTGDYVKKSETPMPFKWLALESIRDHTFSTCSDVWSFGIFMWECFSLGESPYPGMNADQHLYAKLSDGYRMDKPEYATQDIYDIMYSCWHVHPKARPSFDVLEETIYKLLGKNTAEYYVTLNDQYVRSNASNFTTGKTDYLAMMASPDCKAPPSSDTENDNFSVSHMNHANRSMDQSMEDIANPLYGLTGVPNANQRNTNESEVEMQTIGPSKSISTK